MNRRIQRVSELVKQQISVVIQEQGPTDCGFITVTSAEVAPDLKDARIYISVIGSDAQKAAALGTLDKRAGHLQHELGRRVILKYTPRLKFVLDDTEAQAQKIEHLLDELAPPTEE